MNILNIKNTSMVILNLFFTIFHGLGVQLEPILTTTTVNEFGEFGVMRYYSRNANETIRTSINKEGREVDSLISSHLIIGKNPKCSSTEFRNFLLINGWQISKEILKDRVYTVLSSSKEIDVIYLVEKLNSADNSNAFIDFIEIDKESFYPTAMPSDPLFPLQYHLSNAGQLSIDDPWDIKPIGSAGKIGADIDASNLWDGYGNASNIIVAVIDTGVDYTHPDLVNSMWVNPGEIPNNGIDDDNNGVIDDVHGFNAVKNTGDPMEYGPPFPSNHGTNVAGVLGAAANNNEGITGVAPNVRIMSLVWRSPTGFVSDIVECIDYAIQNGADIINLSFGGNTFYQSLFNAVLAARDAGIIIVAAAGNSATDIDLNPHYPASFDLLDTPQPGDWNNIIAVAATDRSDNLAVGSGNGSNFGINSVHIATPGAAIWTTTYPGHGYSCVHGTSIAAPMVSGALALLMQKFEQDNPQEIIHRLLNSSDTLPSLQNLIQDQRRLNVRWALSPFSNEPRHVLWDRYVDWFGFVDDRSFNRIYHGQLGGMWIGKSSVQESLSMNLDIMQGWQWTSKDLFPYIYRFSDGVWLFFDREQYSAPSFPLVFYNFSTGLYEYY
jgi:subtilisin family serine protease